MANVVVIGAGICGLGTALLLARHGHEVTILERDDSPLPDSPQDTWDGWARKGIAQFRQPHNFMPGLRSILETELPDLQEALRDAGAAKFDLLNPLPPSFPDRSARAIDARLWTYTARRPTGDWVFAAAATREPRIAVKRGVQVTDLIAGASAREHTPHVIGVRTSQGEEVRADLVVDATGRGSRSPKWLAAIGARPPYEEQADCGFTYYTRYFSGTMPQRAAGTLTPLGTISLLTLPGDNDTWSITIFTASSDTPLKSLRQADKWTNTVRACPLHAHWLDGEPITDVLVMGGVVDRYRRFVVDGAPVATGFVAVADAWSCTNPSAGRGLTVGFKHALRLRDVLRDAVDDPHALAMQFDAATEAELAPWYRAQIAMDRFRFAQMDALREGREPAPPADELSAQCASLFATMGADPDLFRAGLEYVGTLTPIQELFRRTELVQRAATVMETMRSRPVQSSMPGPNREQLLELVS